MYETRAAGPSEGGSFLSGAAVRRCSEQQNKHTAVSVLTDFNSCECVFVN